MMNEAIKYIHKQIDEIIENEPKVCIKGCSFCCYQQIEIMDIEKKVINDFINEKIDRNTKDIIRKNLKDWLDVFDENTPNDKVLDGKDVFMDFKDKIDKNGLKCPLLIGNLCSIYEMRPITCRIHYVKNSPKKCEENKFRDSAPKGIQLRAYFINSMKTLGETTIESLALAISKNLLPEREIKPIEKIVLR